jgi:hypothetical protein
MVYRYASIDADPFVMTAAEKELNITKGRLVSKKENQRIILK